MSIMEANEALRFYIVMLRAILLVILSFRRVKKHWKVLTMFGTRSFLLSGQPGRTARQAGRLAGRQAGRQADRQADRQAGRTARQNSQAEQPGKTARLNSQAGRKTGRKTCRKTGRQAGRQAKGLTCGCMHAHGGHFF